MIRERIDLVAFDGAKVWHVMTGAQHLTACGLEATRSTEVEVGVDARVVAHRGKTVCVKCRRLGRVAA